MMKGTRNLWRAIVALAIVGAMSFVAMSCKTDADGTQGQTKYEVYANDGTDTGATATPNTATEGTEVTLNRGILAGHTFSHWQAVNPHDLTITDNKFTMPAQNVSVLAIWLSEKDDFVMVPGGKFMMGSPAGTPSSDNKERPVREVTLSTFYMDKYPVTQKDYQAVMGSNPSNFKTNPATGEVQEKRPVELVSWYDALVYANKLSAAKGLTPAYEMPNVWPDPASYSTDTSKWGTVPLLNNAQWNNVRLTTGSTGYRLATEAQWEYVAQGGNYSSGNYMYSGSDTIYEVAWYSGNSGKQTHEVGKKAANGLGLYDMSGNVWEWVWDWYGTYPYIAEVDPSGPSSGEGRALRGGSWESLSAVYVRSTYRIYGFSFSSNFYRGFRLVRPSLTVY